MADIEIPISARMNTSEAESAIKRLINSLNKLNESATGSFALTAPQAQSLGRAGLSGLASKKSSEGLDRIRKGGAISEDDKIGQILTGNTKAIAKFTIRDLMEIRETIRSSGGSAKDPGIAAAFAAIDRQISTIISSKLTVQLDNAEKYLSKNPNARAYINQAIPGAYKRADLSVGETLSAFGNIGEEVMPGIGQRITSFQSAIDAMGGDVDVGRVNGMLEALFNDVDRAVASYVQRTKEKIDNSLLDSSMGSQDYLRTQINSGSRAAVLEAIQKQSKRTDLTEEQANSLRKNIGAISSEVRPANPGTVDAEFTTTKELLREASLAVRQLLADMSKGVTQVEEAALVEDTAVKASAVNAVNVIRGTRNRAQRAAASGGTPPPTSSGGPSVPGGGGGLNGGGGFFGGLGGSAGDMGDNANEAGREVNAAFRKLNRVITDSSALLNSTATIAKGSLRVRDRESDLRAFAADLSKGMQLYVDTVNEAFNNLELPSGRKPPKDILRSSVNESLRNGEAAGYVSLPEEQRGLAAAARGRQYGQAAGLQGAEADKFALAYARSMEDLVQQLTKLGEATAIANLKTIEVAREEIDLLVQQGKYEEAMKIATNILITKTERDALGNANVVTEPIGNRTPQQLVDAGFTTDASNMATGEVKETQRKIDRHKDINKEASGLSKLTRFAGQAMTAFGFLQMTVGTVVAGMTDLIDRANKLEKAAATIRALAGSTEKFSQVLSIAVKQQGKFGGSLEENLQGFVALVPATKKYQLGLEEVDNIARRLAIVDPMQGFSGAAIALKEFLSGDITSLSRRFEIDRKTLNSIKEAGTKAEQLKKLDEVLTSMGISQEVLAARTATTAASFDRAGAAWDNYLAALGQGSQEVFKPLADAAEVIFTVNSANAATNLMLQEQAQTSAASYLKAANSVRDIKSEIVDTVKPANMLEDWFGLASKHIKDIKVNTTDLKNELQYVLNISNDYIDSLNQQRLISGGNADFQRFDNKEQALMYAQAAEFVGAAKVSASRQKTWFYDPNYFAPGPIIDAGDAGSQITDLSQVAPGMNPFIPKLSISSALSVGGKVNSGDATILSDLAFEAFKRVTTPGYDKTAEEALKKLPTDLTKQFNDPNLSKSEQLNKSLAAALQLVADGGMSAYAAMKLFIDVLRTEEPKSPVDPRIAEMERLKKATLEYATINKQIGDNTWATELYGNSVKSIDDYNQQINDSLLKQQGLIYYNAMAQSVVTTETTSTALAQGKLFDLEGETAVERENAAKKIGEAVILQTRLVLEQERSVSVIGAMGENFGGYVKDLEKAAKLAVDFNKSIGGIITGPLMAGMSLQDQMNFSQMQMSGKIPGMEPKNQDEILNLTSHQLDLATQIEQERLDKSANTDNEIKDMNKQFFKDQADARKEHDKEMADLQEEHFKKMEEMRRDSEISKRSNEVGFYEGLFNMDNLTPEQMQQASAEYEKIKAEATDLRSKGQFEKAAAVEAAGKQGILDKYGDIEKKAQFTLDIKESDEKIAELQKRMGEAKTADDKAEIQRQIDKEVAKKAGYENEIKQIEALETLKKNLYEAELNNARTLQEAETENYKIEVEKRNKDFKDKEEEKTRKHAEEVAKRSKVEDAAHKAVISNFNEQVALSTFAYTYMEEAYARTLYGSAQTEALSTIFARRSAAKAELMASTSVGAPIIQGALAKLEASGPSMVQQQLKSLLPIPEGGDGGASSLELVNKDLAEKTSALTTEMTRLVETLLKSTISIVRFGS